MPTIGNNWSSRARRLAVDALSPVDRGEASGLRCSVGSAADLRRLRFFDVEFLDAVFETRGGVSKSLSIRARVAMVVVLVLGH